MKKLFLKVLIFTLVLMISGCSSNTEKEAEAPAESASQPEASSESAADFPGDNQINILVGFSAGGSSDLGVRMLQPYLEEELGTTVNVLNKPGANGWVAWTELASAQPDGYTVGLINVPGFYSGYLDKQQHRTLSLDSYEYIANQVSDWGVLVVEKGRFESLEDFVAYAKENEVTIGDVGIGGNKHMQTEEFKSVNPDCKITPVHMKGWADNYAGVLGGHIDAASATIGDVVNQLQDGEVDVLCVFAPERSPLIPEVPTCEELGFGAIYAPSSRGYILPAGVSPEIKAVLEAAFEKAINNEEHISKMKDLGLAVDYFDGEEYNEFLHVNEEKAKTFAPIFGWE